MDHERQKRARQIIAIRELVAHEAVKAKETSEATTASRADRSDSL